MQGQIETPLGWPEINRAWKRVVDDGYKLVFLGKGADRFQVDYPEQGIGHGFDIDGPGCRLQQLCPAGGIVFVDKIKADTEFRQVIDNKIIGPAIQAFLRK